MICNTTLKWPDVRLSNHSGGGGVMSAFSPVAPVCLSLFLNLCGWGSDSEHVWQRVR